MKILRLTAENVKRLVAVEILPSGNLVVVGGRNGQGKTSTLDAIWMALGGANAIPAQPVRRGEQKGTIELDLGDIVVNRTMTESGGGRLKVSSAEGATFSSPQKMLDELVGRLSFDPLAFSRLKPADQLATLREIVGVDFSPLDAQRAEAYKQRATLNREVKRLEGITSTLKHDPDAPDAEQSMDDLLDELAKVNEVNERNAKLRRERDEANRAELVAEQAVKTAAREYHRLKAEMVEKAAEAEHKMLATMPLEDKDAGLIREALTNLDAVNRSVRANTEYKRSRTDLKAARRKADDMTLAISGIDDTKREMIASAKFPLDGLGFGDDGVTLNELPFDQGSGAEQLRASVAIGLSLNPKLRVLLVRDGSLLDADSMKLLADAADAADAQIWVERVGAGDEVTVVIEDGEVV